MQTVSWRKCNQTLSESETQYCIKFVNKLIDALKDGHGLELRSVCEISVRELLYGQKLESKLNLS